jgi:uncharacterized protein YecT (DUF1311 family)
MRRQIWTGIFAFMLLAAAAPGRAEEPMDAFGACDAGCLREQQKKIDDLWAEAHGLTEGKVAEGLEAEKRAWEAFRDASCIFMLDPAVSADEDQPGFDRCRSRVLADRLKMVEAHLRFVDN